MPQLRQRQGVVNDRCNAIDNMHNLQFWHVLNSCLFELHELFDWDVSSGGWII